MLEGDYLRRGLEGDYLRRGTAEFVGTFMLVFAGVGSMIYGNLLGTAFAFGLTVAIMTSVFAPVSGGHFNPAVTTGALLTRRIEPRLAGVYWLVQFAGATLAALLLKWVLPKVVSGLFVGAPTVNSTIDPAKAVVVEAVLTFFVVMVYFGAVVDRRGPFRQIAGLGYGLAVVVGVAMAGGLTGAALNPARAFGPELASGHWTSFWVWYVGPLAGGILAALIYDVLYLGPATREAEPDQPGAGEAAPATDAEP